MTRSPGLLLAGATALLALSACNPTAAPTGNVATATDQNSALAAPDGNQMPTDDSMAGNGMTNGGMMDGHHEMGMDKMPSADTKMKGKMPMGDTTSNMQSMPKDKADKPMPMEGEMGEM